jgi:hypothetical protein
MRRRVGSLLTASWPANPRRSKAQIHDPRDIPADTSQ